MKGVESVEGSRTEETVLTRGHQKRGTSEMTHKAGGGRKDSRALTINKKEKRSMKKAEGALLKRNHLMVWRKGKGDVRLPGQLKETPAMGKCLNCEKKPRAGGKAGLRGREQERVGQNPE